MIKITNILKKKNDTLCGLLLLIFIKIIILFIYHNEKINIQNIRIKLIYNKNIISINKHDINKIVHKYSKQKYIRRYKLRDIKKILQKKLPIIKNIYLYVDKNENTIYIYLINKNIVVRINNKQYSYYLTDKQEKIKTNKYYYLKNVILYEGLLNSKKDTKNIIKIINYINKQKYIKEYIIGIKKYKNNFYLLSELNNNIHIIKLGKNNNFIIQLIKLKNFYNQYLHKLIKEKYTIINLEYKNQIVAKKNKILWNTKK